MITRFIYKTEVMNMKKALSKLYIIMANNSLFYIGHALVQFHNTESFYSEIHNKEITVCYNFKPFETDIAHLFQNCLSNPI